MELDEPRARIGYESGAISRAKQFALKALVVAGGAVVLVSAFLLSMAFLAVGLAVMLTFGGYLWWQTREVRKQIRARMQGQPKYTGEIIEGEVISREETRR
jgi:hypothetical protein